ncbi:MAG: hypothetical protein DMD26_18425 [Gemmatimonadetes bacterium]|nr:MAG: hypothetical protein DMD26_18425 [Gemmatimonadota bacterium]
MADPARDGAYSPAWSESPPLRVLPAAAPAHGEPHKYLIAFAVVLAALMQVIDSSIVNVALPDMMGNLGASLDEVAWVSTGYILASVIVIPLTGWLGSIFGRKRYFVASIVLFTLASLFCGASHSLAALVFWRIVQGIGGGALMTVSQAVLFEAFPREEAGMAMALFGLGVMVGPTIGPTLGGWLTDNYGWPWIFYINLPVGILAAVMIGTYVHDSLHQQKPPTVDYIGIALLAVSVGAIQYVLEHGQRDDWFDSSLITSLTNLRMTAEQTGIVMLPGAIATALSMFVVGRLGRRFDPRLLITAGALIFATAAWELSRVTGESGGSDFFWPLILRGVGLGLMFVPLTTITLAELSPQDLPQGTGLYNFFRQLGGSFGIAAIATLLARYTTQIRATLTEHVTTTDALSVSRLESLTRAMMARGADMWAARREALTLLDRQLMAQASVIAYSRIYVLSALLILSLIPLLLLVRQTKGATGDHAVME